MSDRFQTTRKEYSKWRLEELEMSASPVEQFTRWFDDALGAQPGEPNAMSLATTDARGRPSVRLVLMKSIDEQGLVFATSYESRKAEQIGECPYAAVAFFWPALERQVRIEGSISKTSPAESDEIFKARPRGSQLAAKVSRQSWPISSRHELEAAYAAKTLRFEGQEILRPENWGGYRIVPDRFEFWQGGTNRLHDRIQYLLGESGWKKSRIQP